MRAVAAVVAAYLITLVAEHYLDLGVLAALLIGAAGLFLRLPVLVVAMPLLGLTHADLRWLRTTIVLYAAYALFVVVVTRFRRKSAPVAKRPDSD